MIGIFQLEKTPLSLHDPPEIHSIFHENSKI